MVNGLWRASWLMSCLLRFFGLVVVAWGRMDIVHNKAIIRRDVAASVDARFVRDVDALEYAPSNDIRIQLPIRAFTGRARTSHRSL